MLYICTRVATVGINELKHSSLWSSKVMERVDGRVSTHCSWPPGADPSVADVASLAHIYICDLYNYN